MPLVRLLPIAVVLTTLLGGSAHAQDALALRGARATPAYPYYEALVSLPSAADGERLRLVAPADSDDLHSVAVRDADLPAAVTLVIDASENNLVAAHAFREALKQALATTDVAEVRLISTPGVEALSSSWSQPDDLLSLVDQLSELDLSDGPAPGVALSEAIQSPPTSARWSIVYLGDGRDPSLEAAGREAAAAGVPVHVVAMGFAPAPQRLRALARASGGELLGQIDGGSSPDQIASVYSMMARKSLATPNGYKLVAFRAPALWGETRSFRLSSHDGTFAATGTVDRPGTLLAFAGLLAWPWGAVGLVGVLGLLGVGLALRPGPAEETVDALAWLVPLNGPRQGDRLPVLRSPTLIGRGEESDLVLEDKRVHRDGHAEIEVDAARRTVEIRDLSGRPGSTLVNGRNLVGARRYVGRRDRLRLGATEFRVEFGPSVRGGRVTRQRDEDDATLA